LTGRQPDRRILVAITAGIVVVGVFAGTAVAGHRDSLRRDALVRARVWCESLVARDALRYQETFQRTYFRGTFDRFANEYREPKESAVRAQMPGAQSCEPTGEVRGPGPRGDVYVPVVWTENETEQRAQLRMRRQAGFLLVYEIAR
jgi:hypothetical protein